MKALRNSCASKVVQHTEPDFDPDFEREIPREKGAFCQTIEDSVSYLSLSDDESKEGIRTIPYSLNIYGGRQTIQIIDSSSRRSRLQLFQSLPPEPPREQSMSLNSSGPRTNQLSSFADSGSQQASQKKGTSLTLTGIEVSETTESSMRQSKKPKKPPSKKIIFCVSNKDVLHNRFSRSVLECISEVGNERSRSNQPMPSYNTKFLTTSHMAKLEKHVKLSPISRMKRGSLRGSLARQKLELQKISKEESVIQESVEESMLTDYWQHKDELEEKYRKLLASFESEEVAEIKLRTAKLLVKKGDSETKAKPEDVLEVISSVKEEYEITRSLILKQKISEIEEMLSKFQKKILD